MPKTTQKKSAKPFRGMMPVLPTPITDSGEVDEKSLRRLVQYCLKCGAVAIGHLGGASEHFKVTDDERRRITEIVVDEVAHRAPVYIGVAGASDRIAVGYARQAQELGADLLMLAPPFAVPAGATELYDYYKAVSEAVTIPIIIQDAGNAPALTAEFMCRLYREMPNIHYVKSEASDFLSKTDELTRLSRGKMPIIGGAGGKHLIHMLRIGVTSFMTGTEALDLHNAVVQAYLSGDEERAARIYFEKVLPYLMFYMEHYRTLLKSMLHERGVIASPRQLLPMETKPLSDVEEREFRWLMKRIGLDGVKWPEVKEF
jgi:dihydrodipicolinate synthase/N-acetylneuraminate lyase